MIASLRHLRILREIARSGSVSEAARLCRVSQPAVTLALARVERKLGARLFDRGPGGLVPTERGAILVARIGRACAFLDPALAAFGPRLAQTVTAAQLRALIAVVEQEGFSQAARHLGLSQPTVHRAIAGMEQDTGHPMFERGPRGVVASRPARALANAARLAFVELEQAQAELAAAGGAEVGRITVGAMPLSRSYLMGPAIARFRLTHPRLTLRIVDGTFDTLAAPLRRGEIDLLVGALRPPEAMPDLRQEMLFSDTMAVVCRPGHPATCGRVDWSRLAAHPWVVAPPGTPARGFFDAIVPQPPVSLIESGSLILMREVLRESDHLGFISARQVAPELCAGTLAQLPVAMPDTARPIGLIERDGWVPTPAQSALIAALRHAAAVLEGQRGHVYTGSGADWPAALD